MIYLSPRSSLGLRSNYLDSAWESVRLLTHLRIVPTRGPYQDSLEGW